MPAVYQTRQMETDIQTLWKIISDLTGYKEWQVLPAGRVTDVKVIQDAGALTRSVRRIEAGGRWFEEEVAEAAAPGFVAFTVLRDSTGDFNRTYKDMTISVKAVPSSVGVGVTMGVTYNKASFIGRWTDWFGPRNWRRAFGKSLANLQELVSRRAVPEMFTPTWRRAEAEKPARPEVEAAHTEAREVEVEREPEPPPEAYTRAAADAFSVVASTEAESAAEDKPAEAASEAAPAQPSRAELEAQLSTLRALLQQSRQLNLPTADIEARIAEVEARLGE